MKRVLLSLVLAVLFIVHPCHAQDRSDLAEKLKASSRIMEIFAEQGPVIAKLGTCTAFSINDEKDYFATAAHCTEGNKLFVGGDEAFPIYVNTEADLAVLVVPDSGEVPALKLGHRVSQGMEVYNYGYGYGLAVPMLRAGHVAIVDVCPFTTADPDNYVGGKDEHFTFTDFVVIPGQSGGPVVDAEGSVVSINQLGDGASGMGRTLSEISYHIGRYFGR